MQESAIKFASATEVILYVGKKLFPKFNLDYDVRRNAYRDAWYIFQGGPQAAQLGVDPAKSIFMTGDIGVGKSSLMRVMQVIFTDTVRRFGWVNAIDLANMLEQYKPHEILQMYGKGNFCDLYIDDIGLGRAGANQKYMGNTVNIIAELLYDRYDLFINQGFKTHISSNIPTTIAATAPSEERSLERMYGDRIIDRLQEMTNLIIWEGKSLRGGQDGAN